MYKRCPVDENGIEVCVFNTDTNRFIPFDEANTDYQEYLKWLAEGNTPEPADSPE